MSEEKAIRYDAEKIRTDLIPASSTYALAEILTMGARKYAPRNWEDGMKWDRVIGSLKRHLLAIENGEDFDKESGMLHAAHVLTNAAFLVEYYKSFPEGDDPRRVIHPMYYKNIGLDIDGVLADFDGSFKERFGIPVTSNGHYDISYSAVEKWNSVKQDESFWMGIKPLFRGEDLVFSPKCYITSRPIDTQVSMRWLEKNGFPCKPCITVAENKLQAVKDYNLDIFVDDKPKTFIELNSAGIVCFLQNTNYNQSFNVGHFRIFHPNDLFNNNLRRIH
jgi:hypothetical protein